MLFIMPVLVVKWTGSLRLPKSITFLLWKITRMACLENIGENFLGTFGCMATQSFHETKNISCGEGGALLINDPSFYRESRNYP